MSVSHSEPFLYVNGKRVALDRVNPYKSLGSFLVDMNLMGARKIDDDDDISGADNVALARYNSEKKCVTYTAIPAFLVPLLSVVGEQVITIEGIGSEKAMHPIQKRFYNCESFQCGYCAGGFIMTLYSLLRENQKPTCADIEDALSGNFCRCTGYRPISAAAYGYAIDAPKNIYYGDPNWKFEESHKIDIEKELKAPEDIVLGCENNYKFKHFSLDPACGIMMKGIEVPGSLEALRQILTSTPNTVVVVPGDDGVMLNDKFTKDRTNDHYTMVHRVQELARVNVEKVEDGVVAYKMNVGPSATIQSVVDALKEVENDGDGNKIIKQILDVLQEIPKGHRNYKSFNVLRKDPTYNSLLSIFNPTTEDNENIGRPELETVIYSIPSEKVLSVGIRKVRESLAHGFITTIVDKEAKKMTSNICLVMKCPNVELKTETLQMDYINANGDLETIDTMVESLTTSSRDDKLKPYLGFLRHSIIIAAVEAGIFDCPSYYKKLATWRKETKEPLTTSRSFPMLEDTVLENKKEGEEYWNNGVGKIPPPNHKLHTKYVHKEILQQNGIPKVTGTIRYPIDKYKLYGDMLYAFPVLTTVPCGTIIDVDISDAQKVPGFFAYYCSKDFPEGSPNVFHGIPPNDTPVLVNKNGRVLHCDQIIGVMVATKRDVAMYCAKLAKVTYDTDMESERNKAFKHRKEIPRQRLDCAGMDNTSVERCYTIEQAMEINSYHPHCGVGERVVTLGLNPIKSPENINNKNIVHDEVFDVHEPDRDTDAPMDPEESKKKITEIVNSCDVKIEGTITVGGQEHFYAEPFTATVVPTSGDTYLVHVSSQNVSKIQGDIARNLCIPSSKIIVKAENIGGGFGGKQDRPQIVAVPCALASYLSGHPVNMTLTRGVDMRSSGGRHGYIYKYSAGFSKDGKFQALDALLVSDGGGTFDCTPAVLDKSIFQNTSVYTVPYARIEGRAARTNHPTNTAYRGFGAPQTTQLIESLLDHAAQVLNMDPTELRGMNMNKPGDKLITGTYTGSTKGCDIPLRLFENVKKMSNYDVRKKEYDEFNKKDENKYIKRGIAIVPLKNSICFEEDFMNQAHSLVHVYTDGTVRVVHSGIEMGQGLHTKMRMVAAETLRVDIDRIYVGPTGSDTCANTQPTAASSGTDVNAPAVRNACEAIRQRLEKVRDSIGSKNEGLLADGKPDPNAPIESYWGEAGFVGVVNTAYFTRVCLSEHNYFCLPHLQWNWPEKIGYTGFYTAYGICCGEVELNAVTGEYKLLRCSLIEDVGNSLNPALDCGQVEGGFTQGLGWSTTEELCYDTEGPNATGTLLNNSLSEYMVPMMRTVPRELQVSLIDGTGDPMSAYGAKASAEAPLCLSSGVHFAIRDAVRAYRRGMGKGGLVRIPGPTTALTVLAALRD